MNARQLLAAYDAQLRTDAETPSARTVTRIGPLRLVTFDGGRGFVTYADLAGADAAQIGAWVEQVQAHFRADPDITQVEWKSRGHDRAPGLHEALTTAGFVAAEPESIMLGDLTGLVQEVALPEGVRLAQVHAPADVHDMAAMQREVFGDPPRDEPGADLLRRLEVDDGMQLWVARAGEEIVCAGRLEPVPGSDFVGIWGGATRPHWRRRGVYRALTAARARAGLALGKRYAHSDSTEFSRPILERSGLVKASTTTPYEWNPHE